MSADTLPSWVLEAAKLPLAFAQVREDPRIDAALLSAKSSVLMVASGGCTAAALAGTGHLSRLHLVDANPAQIALTRLKLHLLEKSLPENRQALLGHRTMPAAARRTGIEAACTELGIHPNVFGPAETNAEAGLDHAGRYERVFAQLRVELECHTQDIDHLLSQNDALRQSMSASPSSALGQALDRAFHAVMARPILEHLFGSAATQGCRQPFSVHFLERLRRVLSELPAANNPFLWQLLRGRHPPGSPADWLALPPSPTPITTWHAAPMDQDLTATSEKFDLIHLSNILDWLDPGQAALTLELARQRLHPGGTLIIRQLNSVLDIPKLAPALNWDEPTAVQWHSKDRSFFYHALHIARA
jgi:S-adenosylmethionine-diacylglycerol 3-amino-3-carboxypropyl transferase